MLQVGNGFLTAAEERAHFSLWALLAAPLLAGYDIPATPAPSLAVLKNRDVIAVDQDRRGRQGRRVRTTRGMEVWVKPLRHGAAALLVFNRTGPGRWAKVWLDSVPMRKAKRYRVRNLWTHETVELKFPDAVQARIPRHGVAMWRLRPRATSSEP
jgi:alpha-galactosidase